MLQAGQMASGQEQGPLILGATGRLGRAFRRLWDDGLWPASAAPLWHRRQVDGDDNDAIGWDLLSGQPPDDIRLRRVNGVIVLAGVTSGSDADLARNTRLAYAAIDLARARAIGPVLLCSSAAVYGRALGPQSETMPCLPANPYGVAKLAMEQAVEGRGAICLRIANVAGSDQLFDAAGRGGVRLDQFSDGTGDGTGPERAYIGPRSLAATMLRLIDLWHRGQTLPDVLNLAAPNPVRMNDLLHAARVPFDWTPAPATALPSVTLDTTLLATLAPLPATAADPVTLVAEARAAGWRPAP